MIIKRTLCAALLRPPAGTTLLAVSAPAGLPGEAYLEQPSQDWAGVPPPAAPPGRLQQLKGAPYRHMHSPPQRGTSSLPHFD